MSEAALRKEGWALHRTAEADIDDLMSWFPTEEDVIRWGGPEFRFPFTRETFLEDMRFSRMASFSLRDPVGYFSAFGQLYDRDGRIHLARLVAKPALRGEGVGKRLMNMLMEVGLSLFSANEYSLFVLRENIPAYECYKALGFVVGDYPADMPYADVCYYLTRPVGQPKKEEGENNDE